MWTLICAHGSLARINEVCVSTRTPWRITTTLDTRRPALVHSQSFTLHRTVLTQTRAYVTSYGTGVHPDRACALHTWGTHSSVCWWQRSYRQIMIDHQNCTLGYNWPAYKKSKFTSKRQWAWTCFVVDMICSYTILTCMHQHRIIVVRRRNQTCLPLSRIMFLFQIKFHSKTDKIRDINPV